MILADIKKMLGVSSTDDHFDGPLIIHINSAISDLKKVGVPYPDCDFSLAIDDDPAGTWEEYFTPEGGVYPNNLDDIKSFIFLSVKLEFDPPTTSFNVTAIEGRLKKLEYRLQAFCDNS